MAKKKAQAPTDAVRNYLSQIGRKGGHAGTGAAKARDSEKMRAAVQKRWDKVREAKAKEPPSTSE
jgi:hypothetical protein